MCGIKYHFQHLCSRKGVKVANKKEVVHKKETDDYKNGSPEFHYNMEHLPPVHHPVWAEEEHGVVLKGYTWTLDTSETLTH